MFIELVDALRCPAPHEESWLVASADRMEARHIVTGTLGCPVCHAQYPIANGVVDMRRDRAPAERVPRETHVQASPPDDEHVLRLAAFLELTDASGFALLLGPWAGYAPALRAQVETPLVAIDPDPAISGEPGISVVLTDGEIPVASGSARAVAIDAGSVKRAAAAASVARAKGRIVAPLAVAVPAGVRELARDETLWVGEREPDVSATVTLHVRRSRQP